MDDLNEELKTILAALAAQKRYSRDDWEVFLFAKLLEEDGHEDQQSH